MPGQHRASAFFLAVGESRRGPRQEMKSVDVFELLQWPGLGEMSVVMLALLRREQLAREGGTQRKLCRRCTSLPFCKDKQFGWSCHEGLPSCGHSQRACTGYLMWLPWCHSRYHWDSFCMSSHPFRHCTALTRTLYTSRWFYHICLARTCGSWQRRRQY